MKRNVLSRILVVLFFGLSFGAFSQTFVTVLSGESDLPVGGVPIQFLDSLSSAIFSTGTDYRGNIALPSSFFSERNERFVTIQTNGFQPVSLNLKEHASTIVRLFPLPGAIGEVVVTGQLTERSGDQSVQKARVIDRSFIDAKGAVNLRDVLQSELNIRVSQDQVLGSGMSLQGMNGQNVKILIDGVPVIGRVDGEIDLSQINLSNVERIEIIEGPSSVSYGSNALAGTINIITKKRDRSGQHLQLNSYVESVGNYNLDGRFSTSIRRSQLQITGVRNYFDGWSDGDPFYEYPQSEVADSGRYQTWKPKMQYQAGAKWLIPVKRVLLTPYADVFYERITNRGLPRAPYYNTAFDDRYVTTRFNAGTQIDARLGDRFRIQGVIAYNDYERAKNTYLKNLNTLEQTLTTTDGDQDTTRFHAWMSRMSFVRHERDSLFNYEIGYDVNSETASGQRILNSEQTITEAALFSNAELTLKKWIFKPGVRVTWNSAYRSSFTPALNIKYGLSKWTFRAGIASGFRSPAIKELYIDFVDINHNIQGNTALKPEQSMHYQVWISTKRTLWKQPLLIDLNGYYQQVSQKIALAQNALGTDYSYFNLDHFEATGIQTSLEYRPGKHQFKVGGAYVGTKSNLTINGYAFSPEITATASLFWKTPEITFSGFYKYTGRVRIYLQSEDGEPQSSFMGAYNLMDISASHPFWKKQLVVSLGAKNLFDVKAVAAGNAAGVHSGGGSSTPVGWGRSVYIKLQLNLHNERK